LQASDLSFGRSVATGTSFLLKEIGPVNSMTATDNSWAAATEATLNATYALHIQGTGRQPQVPVSELGLHGL
jgi:hypothetical protein